MKFNKNLDWLKESDEDDLLGDELDDVEGDEEQINEVRYINPDNLNKYNPDEIEEVTTASGEKRYKRKTNNQDFTRQTVNTKLTNKLSKEDYDNMSPRDVTRFLLKQSKALRKPVDEKHVNAVNKMLDGIGDINSGAEIVLGPLKSYLVKNDLKVNDIIPYISQSARMYMNQAFRQKYNKPAGDEALIDMFRGWYHANKGSSKYEDEKKIMSGLLIEDYLDEEQINEARYINPDNLDRYNPDEIEEVTIASGEKRYKRKTGAQPSNQTIDKKEEPKQFKQQDKLLTDNVIANLDKTYKLSNEQQQSILSNLSRQATSDTIDTLANLYVDIEQAYRNKLTKGRHYGALEDIIKKIDNDKLIDIAKSLNIKTKDIDSSTLLRRIYKQLEHKADDKIWSSKIDNKIWEPTKNTQQQIKTINDKKGNGDFSEFVSSLPKNSEELAKAIKDIQKDMSNPLAFNRLMSDIAGRQDIYVSDRNQTIGGLKDRNSYLRGLCKELHVPIKYDREGRLYSDDVADKITNKLYGKNWFDSLTYNQIQ